MTYEDRLLDGVLMLGTRDKYEGLDEHEHEGSGKKHHKKHHKGGVLMGGHSGVKHHMFHHDLNTDKGCALGGSTYVDFVREFRKHHPHLSWKEALVAAKPEYHRMHGSGGAMAAGAMAAGRRKPHPKTSVGTYVDFVREFHKHHPHMSWKEAMVEAKSHYHKAVGGAPRKHKADKEKAKPKVKRMSKKMHKEVGGALAAALAAGTHAVVPIEMVKLPKDSKPIRKVGRPKKVHLEGEHKVEHRGRPKKVLKMRK